MFSCGATEEAHYKYKDELLNYWAKISKVTNFAYYVLAWLFISFVIDLIFDIYVIFSYFNNYSWIILALFVIPGVAISWYYNRNDFWIDNGIIETLEGTQHDNNIENCIVPAFFNPLRHQPYAESLPSTSAPATQPIASANPFDCKPSTSTAANENYEMSTFVDDKLEEGQQESHGPTVAHKRPSNWRCARICCKWILFAPVFRVVLLWNYFKTKTLKLQEMRSLRFAVTT